MCGRFVIFNEQENEEIRNIVDQINKKYNSQPSPQAKIGREILPTDYIPVVALNNSGNRHLGLVKWGFPGYQNKGVIINARAETLEEKPTFRRILNNRCIIPASAYFEWQKAEGNKKIKHMIRPDIPMFYMAGLFNTFQDHDGKSYAGAVIITTEPAPAIAHIHNRMPVILHPNQAGAWLKNSDYKQLLLPYQGHINCFAA